MTRRILALSAGILVLMTMAGCGYNKIQGLDEEVKSAWAEVLNQYQRRFDLIPNLVNTVKGYASHERETLQAVTEARAKVGQMQVDASTIDDAQAFQNFQSAQAGLAGALQRLMVVVERYPDLKANQNFRDLQVQLEGTENRIAVARRRYIEAVKTYNVSIRKFPQNIIANIFNFERADFYEAPEAAKEVPKVKF